MQNSKRAERWYATYNAALTGLYANQEDYGSASPADMHNCALLAADLAHADSRTLVEDEDGAPLPPSKQPRIHRASKQATSRAAAESIAALLTPIDLVVRLSKDYEITKDDLLMMIASYWDVAKEI